MLPQAKVPPALYAIHTVLVRARDLAAEQIDAKHMFEILDYAELLPALVVNQSEDTTEQFRGMLLGLGERYSQFKGIAEMFDRDFIW